MEKKNEQFHPDQWLKDLPSEPEIQKFSAEAMIACDKCGRKSPPTRLKCLYCGAVLQISHEQSAYLKPNLRKLDDWEKGFNLVLQPHNVLENSDKLSEIAALLHLENDDLTNIFKAQMQLPIARAETKTEAEVLAIRLQELKIAIRIIGDEELNNDKPPKRLRGLEFSEDKLILILFNADEIVQIDYAEVNLIVVGAIYERKTEASESVKKKDAGKVLEWAEISNDETYIDIYTATDSVGYRIESKGFDFSCLEREKALLVKDNMPKLIEKLRVISPNAKFNNQYLQIRGELSKVWEATQQTEAGGLQRKGMLGVKRTNITTVSNESQFTRFSRLQWHIL